MDFSFGAQAVSCNLKNNILTHSGLESFITVPQHPFCMIDLILILSVY